MDAASVDRVKRPFDSPEDSDLVHDLRKLSQKDSKLVRSTAYQVPSDPSVTVRSWKLNEFKFYNVPSPFPTLARGLFTQEIPDPDNEGKLKDRIVARGYDKFFNIGEVPWTTWSFLEGHTAPPYTLTLKSNGCIIFIAALTPQRLLVTSKHAVGPAKEVGKSSHAEMGELWLHKHLSSVGKTEAQLARTLWEHNWTAIAELCDDSFEEHVLPYGPEKTGLHLHGLNECRKQFKTMSTDVVDAFAFYWGFIPTASMVLQSIPEVKAFTEEIGRSGKWNGEALEGFVVRTHARKEPEKDSKMISPYAAGSSFFFKVKFDEPYMMYRDWREVTKTLLSKGGDVKKLPKSKLRREETKVYVNWVVEEIKRDRSQFDGFQKGRGIIATRERFLKWMQSHDGQSASKLAKEEAPQDEGEKKFGKTIIVPVAIPGVGKTAIAIALSYLFGFGHTQSDDVHSKKAAGPFVKNVVKLLQTHDVVIADKNNHLKQHRQALRDATESMSPPVRLMALNWSFDQPIAMIHRICGDRIVARGNNHQSLRADPLTKAHEEILWQFIRLAEDLTEDEVDVSVDMDYEESLEDALTRAVDACVRILGVPKPDQEKMGLALAAAKGYTPTIKKPDDKKPKVVAARYFGLLAEVDLKDVLGQHMADSDGNMFWTNLIKEKRVASRPHVTVTHENTREHEEELWSRCMRLHALLNAPLFKFRLGHVVWNERVMAVTVEDLAVSTDVDDTDGSGADFVSTLPPEVQNRLHITVGTLDKTVPPVEAKSLVEDWRTGVTDGIKSSQLTDIWVKARLKGLSS